MAKRAIILSLRMLDLLTQIVTQHVKGKIVKTENPLTVLYKTLHGLTLFNVHEVKNPHAELYSSRERESVTEF